MSFRAASAWSYAAILAVASVGPAQQGEPSAAPTKKVLVELYTSQGCDSCPSANDLLGRLAAMGYGPDQVVPIAFHVDYFNTPWVDPFSKREYSQRQLSYNAVLKRNDLYFTPMMMVDGRYPMLGSNRPEAVAAIGKSLKGRPGVAIKIALDGPKGEKEARVDLAKFAPELEGRNLMVGLALTEGPIATEVPSGENAGKTLVEPHVVRSFAYKNFKPAGREPRTMTFPLKLAGDSKPGRCRVSAWVQDAENGKVYQAESIAWDGARAVAGR